MLWSRLLKNPRLIAALSGGSLLFLEGCDPTIRSTIENGIITSSTSLLTAVLNAFVSAATAGAAAA